MNAPFSARSLVTISDCTSADDMSRSKPLCEPVMRWVNARCATFPDAEIDARFLREFLQFRKMSSEHPIRALWTAETVGARHALHHLADDIRQVRDVPGFLGVIRHLQADVDGYEDTRYELRIAAALARGGQNIHRLG